MHETFDHTADLGLRIRAGDLNELFAEAGRALFSIIVSNPEDIQSRETACVELENEDRELLLFDWLNELLYLFESRRLVCRAFDVRIAGDRLTAMLGGETLDESRHRLEHEVKAITYHDLKVEQQPDGWLAEVIVDI